LGIFKLEKFGFGLETSFTNNNLYILLEIIILKTIKVIRVGINKLMVGFIHKKYLIFGGWSLDIDFKHIIMLKI